MPAEWERYCRSRDLELEGKMVRVTLPRGRVHRVSVAEEPEHTALIRLPRLSAMARNFLGLLVVNFCQCIVCMTVRMQQLVELRLERLSVAVFSALYEKRHEPNT